MRNALVGAVIVAVVAVMVWAGVHNLHARKAMEAKERTQAMTVTSDNAGAIVSGSESASSAPSLVGKSAAVFTLTTTTGKHVSLADLKGKPVMVNFWATWCTPCKVEMPWFEDFSKKYQAQGLQVLGINEDDDATSDVVKGEIAKTLDKTGVTYPILMSDKKVGEAYGGLDMLPATFFIGRDGKIVAQAIGLASKDEAENNVKKILGGS